MMRFHSCQIYRGLFLWETYGVLWVILVLPWNRIYKVPTLYRCPSLFPISSRLWLAREPGSSTQPVLSFYLAAQEEGVDDFLRIVTPVKKHDYIIDLWKRSQRKIGYWLQGQILLGVIIGVLTYIVLMIVGIPHALILALVAAAFEIIPVFGPIIAAVPAVLIAFSAGGFGKAVLLAGLYIIIHQFENHLFYPLVTKKIVGISPIVVILALVIGFKLAGILGAILAVPLSAAFMEYIHDIEKSKKAEKSAIPL